MDIQLIQKTFPLRNISISIDDIRRMVELLLPLVKEEGQRMVGQVLQNRLDNQVNVEQLEAERERAFRITITIEGKSGENLFGYGAEPFDSPNIPEPIKSIYISNVTAFQNTTGNKPINNFTLHLDFSMPPLIDSTNLLSNPTSNLSHFIVDGERGSWVASVQQTVMDVLNKKANNRGFLHSAFIYDIGLVFLGLPAAIYFCWRLSGFVETNFGSLNSFIASAVYIYIVFFVLSIYRVLFGYTRWAFPTLELTDNNNRPKTHRKFWYWIMVGLLVSVISNWIF